MTTIKVTPSRDGQVALDSLQNAVTKILKKKKLLGQYAVVWEDGKPAIIGGAKPKKNGNSTTHKQASAAGGRGTKKSKAIKASGL